MKGNKPSKSFSFQVAKSAPAKNKALKARDGVAVAGCTIMGPFDIPDPVIRARTRFGDTGFYC